MNCEICGGTGWLLDEKNNFAVVGRCACVQRDNEGKMLKTAGYGPAVERYTMENYKTYNNQCIEAKSIGTEYIKRFAEIVGGRDNSVLLLGQVGAGKTHLGVAISKAIMTQYNVKVVYLPYREEITRLKQLVNADEIEYTKQMKKYKDAGLLFIDDLFKGGATEADIRHMFSIIDYRYRNLLPMIINSEHGTGALNQIDEAIASRLVECSRGRTVEFIGKEKNQRTTE